MCIFRIIWLRLNLFDSANHDFKIFALSLSGGTFIYVKRWWRRGRMLANGNWCSGFESRRRLRLFPDFSPHPDFTTSVSATPTFDVSLFFSYCLYLFLYGLIVSHLTYPYLFFPLNSYADLTNLTNVYVHSNCLCWDPAIRTNETGVACLQWRQKRGGPRWAWAFLSGPY